MFSNSWFASNYFSPSYFTRGGDIVPVEPGIPTQGWQAGRRRNEWKSSAASNIVAGSRAGHFEADRRRNEWRVDT